MRSQPTVAAAAAAAEAAAATLSPASQSPSSFRLTSTHKANTDANTNCHQSKPRASGAQYQQMNLISLRGRFAESVARPASGRCKRVSRQRHRRGALLMQQSLGLIKWLVVHGSRWSSSQCQSRSCSWLCNCSWLGSVTLDGALCSAAHFSSVQLQPTVWPMDCRCSCHCCHYHFPSRTRQRCDHQQRPWWLPCWSLACWCLRTGGRLESTCVCVCVCVRVAP